MFQKRSLCLLAALAVAFTFCGLASAQVRVKGYTRKDGTYVQPHMRSSPNGNFYDNWSTKGNVNPYTGKAGTKVSPPGNYGQDVHVSGYTRRDGTFVKPHMRSAPDGDLYNNFSTKGNVNPYTGKPGTKRVPLAPTNSLTASPLQESDYPPEYSSASFDYDLLLTPEERERQRILDLMEKRRSDTASYRQRIRSFVSVKYYGSETSAEARYDLAHKLYLSGKVESAKRWLIELVDKYPHTATADRARVTLAQL